MVTKENKAITLIALAVTIIVLLILVGVSITMLTGQNGILNKAKEAKETTLQAQKEEQATISDYEDNMSNYLGIDWERAKANTKAPEEQKDARNNGVIGIGTNGKAVNMDLWEYSLLPDGTYGLNTEVNLIAEASANISAGYKGTITEAGTICGKIPQYISNDNGLTYKPVTDLKWLFYNCTELKSMPKIPETVKSMRYTFRGCTNLSNTTEIPYGVTDIARCFYGCINLSKPPQLPDTITDMSVTFYGSGIQYFDKFPSSLQDMSSTFIYCTNLTSVGTIPSSVINMNRTFYGCTNLSGILEINANLTGKIIDETSRG